MRGSTIICDGCERGFHLACSGLLSLPSSGDWHCAGCEKSGRTRNRWKLGPVQVFDINAPPPINEMDVDRMEGTEQNRTNYFDGPPMTCSYPQLPHLGPSHPGNYVDGEKKGTSYLDGQSMTCSYSQLPHLVLSHPGSNVDGGRSIVYDLYFDSADGENCWSAKPSISDQPRGEGFLHYLRKFIMERGGFLGEDWHVEVGQYSQGAYPHPVYCSPDGKKFESMFDVASYLGLKSNYNTLDNNERNDCTNLMRRQLLPHKKKNDRTWPSKTDGCFGKLSPFLIGETSVVNDVMSIDRCNGINFSGHMESVAKKVGSFSEKDTEGLPIKYGDFYVVCLGKIDLRAPYHDASQICPVGFKSCWHDRVTSSLFECEVSDGGNSGPLYKVRRSPCSISPVPNAVTTLMHNKDNVSISRENFGSNNMVLDAGCEKNDDILTLLSDPTPEHDPFSYISKDCGSTLGGSSMQMGMQDPSNSLSHHVLTESSNRNTCPRDGIGTFSVEGKSSSLVWNMVANTLIDACREIYKNTGTLHFFCEHNDDTFSPNSGFSIENFGSLAKFSSSSGPRTNFGIRREKEFEDYCTELAKWLCQDRFGLDADFVQEIIESIPASSACLQYQVLKQRRNISTLCTVGNGFFLAIQNGKAEEAARNDLCRGQMVLGRQEYVETPHFVENPPPQGRPLSNKLPPELVGDVLQIWELLCRFYDVLGLNEPLSFEELEEELIDPWPCDSAHMEIFEKVAACDNTVPIESDRTAGLLISSSSEHDSTINGDDLYRFIPNDTGFVSESIDDEFASRTYGRCTGIALSKVHSLLLEVLITELLSKAMCFVDPNSDYKEIKSRRGKRREDSSLPVKDAKVDALTINELTWPELARRYVLAVSSLKCRMDSGEGFGRVRNKVFRCLYGDGGVLCGALSGVSGMETDALFLAEAEKQISVSSKLKNEAVQSVSLEPKDCDIVIASERVAASCGNSLPEWAQPLEPVRKLPTNVGTRIRRCVYESLSKNPPEWAKSRLEHSISKEIYKGNASGPTKKIVLSLLSELSRKNYQKMPEKVPKKRKSNAIPDIVMNKCRIVLRSTVSADEEKLFCNLLGSRPLNAKDNEDKGILGSPAMVSRPLDFRTIDLRLEAGAYCGSHASFLEDVRELWHNIRIVYGDRHDVMDLADKLSLKFEELYEKEVLTTVRLLHEPISSNGIEGDLQKNPGDSLLGTIDVPKAPWEDGVCKVCGIDKDDDSVLLCDSCDSEYHKYCLSPPLSQIPKGNWYCPSCVRGQHMAHNSKNLHFINQPLLGSIGMESRAFLGDLNMLAISMNQREYWDLTPQERIFLLKFLCDEVLSSARIREHIEKCSEKINDMQQRLRSLSQELRNLKYREEFLAMKSGIENSIEASGMIDTTREVVSTLRPNNGKLTGQQPNSCTRLDYGMTFSQYLPESAASESKMNENNTLSLISHEPFYSISPMKEDVAKEQNCGIPISEKVDSEAIVAAACDVDVKYVLDKLDAKDLVSAEGSLSLPPNVLTGPFVPTDNISHHLENIVPVSEVGTSTSMELCPPIQEDISQGNFQFLHASVNDSEVGRLEIISLRMGISQLQDAIAALESELVTLSLRREFIGKDSCGRLYWVVGRHRKHSWLLVDGGKNWKENDAEYVHSNKATGSASCSVLSNNVYPCGYNDYDSYDGDLDHSRATSVSWTRYESDCEIQELLNWLRESDPREKELKYCITQWLKTRLYKERNHFAGASQSTAETSASGKLFAPYCLTTKAAVILTDKYGPCLESESGDDSLKRAMKGKDCVEEKFYRCDCLEPVLPSRYHCPSCHQTSTSANELEGHNNGRCFLSHLGIDEGKENDDTVKCKGTRSENSLEKENYGELNSVQTSKVGKDISSLKPSRSLKKSCPYYLDVICRRFPPTTTTKELVQGIGLIGSNGIPSFVPNSFADFFECGLVLPLTQISETTLNNGRDTPEGHMSPQSLVNVCDKLQKSTEASTLCSTSAGEVISSVTKVDPCHRISESFNSCNIPELSLRPLLGRNSEILRRLKINLLDIDAALPEDAFKSSKYHPARRCAWREFVKSSEAIFEVVQATILLEGMIKSDFLKNSWWYWSSVTAAVMTPNISSLALRIYTFDDCILYDKSPQDMDTIRKTATKSGRKRKDIE